MKSSSCSVSDTNRRAKDMLYGDESEINEALKKKDKEKADRAQSRRRVRGGGPAGASASRADNPSFPKPEPQDVNLDEMQSEADNFAQL